MYNVYNNMNRKLGYCAPKTHENEVFAVARTSIVVPVYNVEKYVGKCIDSILAQTDGDFELLLIDDGTKDTSGEICDAYGEKDSRVKVIHQENKGLGGARNTGIEAATGEWILFVDSDDWLEPDILEKAGKTARETGADLVMFGFRSVDELGTTLQNYVEELPKGQVLEIAKHPDIYLTAPCAWNKLYKTELFRKTGVRYPNRVWYEDIRTTLKLFLAAKTAVFLDDIGYNYLLRSGSITNNVNADRNAEIIDAFEDILSYFKEQGALKAYEDVLCYLTVFHVYLTASVRVLRIDPAHPLLQRFREYTYQTFPNWKKNPYLSQKLGRKRKLLLSLLEKRLYSVIRLMFRLRG